MSDQYKVEVQQGSERSLTFVRSELDDACLTASEFRVYCHIARREGSNGDCYATAATMAKKCRLNEDTVWDALASLVRQNLIRKVSRVGTSNLLYLTNQSEWKLDPTEKRGRPLDSGAHLSESRGSKGTPGKGAPIIARKREADPTLLKDCQEIYEAYPRKSARPVALAAIQKAKLANPQIDLLAAVKKYAQWSRDEKVEPRFIPMPATWFNQERWSDDLVSQRPQASTAVSLNRDIELVRNSEAFPGGVRWFTECSQAEKDAYLAARARIEAIDPHFNFQELKR